MFPRYSGVIDRMVAGNFECPKCNVMFVVYQSAVTQRFVAELLTGDEIAVKPANLKVDPDVTKLKRDDADRIS